MLKNKDQYPTGYKKVKITMFLSLTQLESIQRFVTQFDGRSYQDRCIDLNLLPLCLRRKLTDIVLFCLNE